MTEETVRDILKILIMAKEDDVRMKDTSESKRSPFHVLFKYISEAWKTRNTPLKIQTENGSITVTGYKDSLLPKAEIPSEICGLPVRAISARAFHQCIFLKEMRILDGTETIGANAFSTCDQMTHLYMEDSVQKIGRNAFFECKNLFCVELSNTLKEIDSRAFYGCVGIRDIRLPDSLESIGEQAFYGCNKLKSINIPLSLKSLPRSAFEGCTALDHIYLEKGSYADKVLSDSEYFSKKLRYIPRI